MEQMQAPQQPQGGSTYPSSKEQAEKFFYGLVKELHSTDAYLKPLADKSAPLGVRIGSLAGRALVNMFNRVIEQTGLQVNQDFVVTAIKVAVSEVASMAKEMGEEPTPEDMKQAAKIAGDNLQQTMDQMTGQRQQQPQQQQPQGLMQEVM